VSLPLLEGPRTPGLAVDGDGFIPVDACGRVPGAPDVYAAGDATASRIKQGGLACQQADVVAEQIAAAAGAPIRPSRYRPVLRGKLMTGGRARFLRSGAGDDAVAVSELPLWWPPAKIAGRYLSSFLADRDTLEAGGGRVATHIRVELPLDDLS
jgi:sulfide:quinone oxidoreductase